MPCLVTVGGFYGDEGKGKIIAYLAKKDNPTIAVRGGVEQVRRGHVGEHPRTVDKARLRCDDRCVMKVLDYFLQLLISQRLGHGQMSGEFQKKCAPMARASEFSPRATTMKAPPSRRMAVC